MGELFVLHKARREAKALLLTHQLGWEVRLMIGAQLEVVQTKVCRSQEEVFECGEQWKAAMTEKGWRTMDTERGNHPRPIPLTGRPQHHSRSITLRCRRLRNPRTRKVANDLEGT